MSQSQDDHYESSIPCPHCKERGIQTVAEASFIRGMLLAHQSGVKRFVGCVPCVSGELRGEAGRSLLYGWFSPTALILTVIYVPWNFAKSFSVKPDKEKVRALLRELGVPDDDHQANVNDAMYAALAAMILADGKIDPAELQVAQDIGARFIAGFSMERLQAQLQNPKGVLKPKDVAALLNPYLSMDNKMAVLTMLLLIAKADGDFAAKERDLLIELCEAFGVGRATFEQMMQDAS